MPGSIRSSPDLVADAEADAGTDAATDVVYLVLAHDQPDHLGRLLRRLAGPGSAFVVHVDRHVDQAPFERAAAGVAGVAFVPDRVRVRWAAFSQVESTLRAMRVALDRFGAAPTHLVVLSGADYPVKSNEAIHAHLRANAGRQFIRRFDVLTSDARQRRRVRGRHFRQLADRNTVWRKPLFAVETALLLLPRRLPAGLRFTSGSNWIAITPAFARWCLEQVEASPRWRRLFRGMFGPDEIVFHTMLDASPFAASAPDVEPYYDVTSVGGPWGYGNLHYLHPIVAITDLETVQRAHDAPGVLFARKFDARRSAEVLDALDARLPVGRP